MSNYILKTTLFFNTVKNLKLEQILHQLLNRMLPSRIKKIDLKAENIKLIEHNFPLFKKSYDGSQFSFLNISKEFSSWNEKDMSKLWLYHLHYFDYINSDIPKAQSLKFIESWINDNPPFTINAWEPYTTSLRIVNWIKFLSEHEIRNERIEKSLSLQSSYLNSNLEKHISANHYFTNIKAMLFSAIYFQNKDLIRKFSLKFLEEVKGQFKPEGIHYELSPAYHALLLNDLIEVYLIVDSKNELKSKLIQFIHKAYQYYKLLLMPNGELSRFGDTCLFNSIDQNILEENYKKVPSTNTEAFSPTSFFQIKQNKTLCLFKTKSFTPQYQPGHSHCDIGSYELFIGTQPFIVDTGISTYEENERRILERSSESHNVLMRNNENQADIWKAFRVAARAKNQQSQFKDDQLNTNYSFNNVNYNRSVSYSQNCIKIKDSVSKEGELKTLIHLHPKVSIDIINNDICLSYSDHAICIKTDSTFEIEDYRYCLDFNQLTSAKRIVISKNNALDIEYEIHEK